MVVPLTALKGSLDCYSGTVREVTHDEIVLADVLEQTRMEYATSSQRPPITRQKRDLVRVPRTGIDTIWALPPARNDAAGRPPSPPPQPTAIALPSNGASAVLPPTPNNPAGFDPPQAAGDAARVASAYAPPSGDHSVVCCSRGHGFGQRPALPRLLQSPQRLGQSQPGDEQGAFRPRGPIVGLEGQGRRGIGARTSRTPNRDARRDRASAFQSRAVDPPHADESLDFRALHVGLLALPGPGNAGGSDRGHRAPGSSWPGRSR